MRLTSYKLVCSGLLALGLGLGASLPASAGATSAGAAPAVAVERAAAQATTPLVAVDSRRHWKHRKRHGWRDRHRHRRHGRHRRSHGGIYFRFGTPPPYYARPRYVRPRPVRPTLSAAHVRWCHNRYRSYRSSDNTFQPYNGPRRACVSPYYR